VVLALIVADISLSNSVVEAARVDSPPATSMGELMLCGDPWPERSEL
jgi:hypothetical protein